MQKYKYVYEVYKEGSFSKAAKNLYISQPALSNTIKKIEQNLGQPLFDRSTSVLRLTKAGEIYVDIARKILSLEDELQVCLDDLANLKTGNLVLAGTAFYSSYVISRIAKIFQEKYPGIHLEIIEADSQNLYDTEQNNDWDLILDGGKYNKQKFDAEYLYEERILLAVPKYLIKSEQLSAKSFTSKDVIERCDIDKKEGIRLSELGNIPFLLMKKEYDLYDRMMAVCHEHEYTPYATVHLNQLMTTYNLVQQNFGAALVPESLIRYCGREDEILYFNLDIKDKKILHRNVFIAYRKNTQITNAMRRFIDEAKNIFAR